MGIKLTKEQFEQWKKRLDAVRKNSDFALSALSYTADKNSPQAAIYELVSNIKATRSENKYLGLSDDTTLLSNLKKGKKIQKADYDAIDDSITSLIRTCANVTCQTVCNNTGSNSNVAHDNSYHSNVICSNGAHSNGYNSNGNNMNIQLTNGPCDNMSCNYGSNWNGWGEGPTLSNGTHSNGFYCSNGYNSNGTKTNGYNTNGCSDKIYDEATATYSAKNYYTKEEALARLGITK